MYQSISMHVVKIMQKRENSRFARPSVFLLFFLETHFDFSFPQKKPFDFLGEKNANICVGTIASAWVTSAWRHARTDVLYLL